MVARLAEWMDKNDHFIQPINWTVAGAAAVSAAVNHEHLREWSDVATMVAPFFVILWFLVQIVCRILVTARKLKEEE
jgi:urea transporter